MSLKYKDGTTTYTPWQTTYKSCLRTSDNYGCVVATRDGSYVSMIYYQTNGSSTTTTYNLPIIQTNTIVDGSTISTYALHFLSYPSGHKTLHCRKGSYKFKEIAYSNVGTLPNSYTVSDTVLNKLGCIRITTVRANGLTQTSKTYIVGPNTTKTYNDGSTLYTWTGTSTVIGYVNGTTAYYKGTYTSSTIDYSGLCYLGTAVNSTYNKLQNCNLSSTSSNFYPLTIATSPTGFTGVSHTHTFTVSNTSVSACSNDKNGSYNAFTNMHNCTANSTHTHSWNGYGSNTWEKSWVWWNGYDYSYKLVSPITNAKVIPSGAIVFTLEGQAMDSSYATEIKFTANTDILTINNSSGVGSRISHVSSHYHDINGGLSATGLNDCGYTKSATINTAHSHTIKLTTSTSSWSGSVPVKRLRLWKLTANKNVYDLPTYVYFLIYDTTKLPNNWEVYNVNWGTYNSIPICINTNTTNSSVAPSHAAASNLTATTTGTIATESSAKFYTSNTRYTKSGSHTHTLTYSLSAASHTGISNLPKCSLALCHRKS